MSAASHPARLSLFQESICFFKLLDPATGSFNVARAWTLRGPVDVAVLQRSLDLVAARHEILRGQVVVVDGISCMATVADRRLSCQLIDFSSDDRETARERALTFLQEEFARQFDFESGPLVRAHLVRLTPDEHILMIVKPHLITDEASMGIFAAEWAREYSAMRSGEDVCLPMPVQFATFAASQRAFCYGPAVGDHLAYWRGLLAGAPASLALPKLNEKDAAHTSRYAGGEARFSLARGLLDRLNEMRRTEGATLYVVFLTAFAILLRRLSGQDDIVIGGLLANRIKPATHSLIGPLVNTFAVRFQFAGSGTAREMLGAARNQITSIYRYSELPFERIIEDLKGAQLLDPRFRLSAVFDYFGSPTSTPRFEGLEVTPARVYRRRAQAALILKVWPEGDGMAVFFEYQLAYFGAAGIERVFALYESILTQMAHSPGAALSSMHLPVSPATPSAPRAASRDSVPAPVSAATLPTAEPAAVAVPSFQEILSLLISIWAKVFRTDDIGPEDDFFERGGHSLLAVQIVNHIWDRLGVDVPMEMLFTDAATVQTLAQYVFSTMSNASGRAA